MIKGQISPEIQNAMTEQGQAPMTVKPRMTQPSYANEVPYPKSEHGFYEQMMTGLGAAIGCLGAIPCVFCCPNPFKTIEQGKVGLHTRFGKYFRSVDPGLYFVNVCSERMYVIDIKLQVEDIPKQSVMSKDNVVVLLDSVLYWHVVDPYLASFLVGDVKKALIDRTQTTLRHILGMRTVQDAIENRETYVEIMGRIAHEIQSIIAPAAETWGVKIESILIKDLQFSGDLQDSLSAAAKQKRIGEARIITAKAEGESKVIFAQAEVQSAKLMREAADILNTPAAMQIRYLETMQHMASSGQAKVIFMPATEGLSMSNKKLGAKEIALLETMSNQ